MSPSPGIPSVEVAEAERLRREASPGALVVDVREPNEFGAVRIEGSVLLPLSTFGLRYVELPKDRPLLMLCKSGSRSILATAHLIRNGWTDVSNVAGGIDAWQRAGLPVRHGPVGDGEGVLRPAE